MKKTDVSVLTHCRVLQWTGCPAVAHFPFREMQELTNHWRRRPFHKFLEELLPMLPVPEVEHNEYHLVQASLFGHEVSGSCYIVGTLPCLLWYENKLRRQLDHPVDYMALPGMFSIIISVFFMPFPRDREMNRRPFDPIIDHTIPPFTRKWSTLFRRDGSLLIQWHTLVCIRWLDTRGTAVASSVSRWRSAIVELRWPAGPEQSRSG